MRAKHFYFLLTTIIFFSFSAHKYYISLTDINYSDTEKAIQIITNVFIDDIEKAINKRFNIDSNIDSNQEITNITYYYKEYLKNNIHFTINGEKKQFTYLGNELEGDLIFFYLEIKQIEDLKEIVVENTILVDQFENQQNIIKVKNGNTRKSKILNFEDDKALLKF